MIYQFFALVLIMAIVWYLGYRKGKTIRQREYAEMEEPALTKEENQEYMKFKLFDQMMTDDDFFSDDIEEPSTTDTNKDINKE